MRIEEIRKEMENKQKEARELQVAITAYDFAVQKYNEFVQKSNELRPILERDFGKKNTDDMIKIRRHEVALYVDDAVDGLSKLGYDLREEHKDDSMTFRQFARFIDETGTIMNCHWLTKWLRENRYLTKGGKSHEQYRRNRPMGVAKRLGLLIEIEKFTRKSGQKYKQTVVTPKGQDYFAKKLEGAIENGGRDK